MSAYRFPRARLLLFAREPLAGKVKTRLQPELEAAGCLDLHRTLLRRAGETMTAARLAPWQLWVDGNPGHADFLALCDAASIYRQQGADLGARMQHAAAQALASVAVDMVVLVGADCPAVDSAYMAQALDALTSGAEVVIGPAEDGGYVLLGLRQADAAIFTGVQWGRPAVCAQTRANLKALAIDPVLLATRWDVDRPADLLRLTDLQPPLPMSPGLRARIAALAERSDGAG